MSSDAQAIRDPQVQRLLDRDAIRELMYRYARGVDRSDPSLLLSIFSPDATVEYGSFKGLARDFVNGSVGTGDAARLSRTHHVTNMHIEIDGDLARSETYLLAFHPHLDADRGERMAVGSARHLDRLERIDGTWLVVHRVVVMDWSREHLDGVPWPAVSNEVGGFIAGLRGMDDPSYEFFATAR